MPTARKPKLRSEHKKGRVLGDKQVEQRPAAAVKKRWVLAVLLAVGTLAVYSPVLSYPFTNYDDNEYVTQNSHIQQGISCSTIAWAFRSTQFSNWHPVTWLSHALDWQLFGKDAGGHHFTGIFFHALNAGLLFLLLSSATGKKWRSLFVAALFAVHPLNVESVAWVAERKTVLSMFFMLLTIAAYAWYARQPEFRRYVCIFVLFALGLAAKPMIVTLPFLLMLLDYWPLGRMAWWSPKHERFVVPQKPWRSLAVEKIPLLILSGASCVITVMAQRGSIPSAEQLSFGARLSNAVHSYLMYLGKTFWPNPLVVYYPLDPGSLATWMTVLSFLLLAAVSVAVWKWRAHGYLLTGWFWFLGTLVPMIGLVQVGNQAMADRYAYLPLIGFFLGATWGVADMAAAKRVNPKAGIFAGGIVLLCLTLVTLQQMRFWNGSQPLWTHTLDVTKHNLVAERNLYIAEDNLAYELLSQGRAGEALEHFQTAARLAPADPLSHWALASSLEDQGHLSEALQNYEIVTRNPENSRQLAAAYLSMGVISTELGDYKGAREYSQKALQTDSQTVQAMVADAERSASEHSSADTELRAGLRLEQAGELAKARDAYQQVIRFAPHSALAHRLLEHLDGGR